MTKAAKFLEVFRKGTEKKRKDLLALIDACKNDISSYKIHASHSNHTQQERDDYKDLLDFRQKQLAKAETDLKELES